MKKKTFVIFLSIAVISSLAIGATIAYFTATDDATNTFTVGNVKIDLKEPTWDSQGKLDAPEAYPGEPLAKDPYVINTGANPCVVRIKVDLPANVPGITFRSLDTTNWYKDGDYYYYLKPLGIHGDTTLSDETTKLFTHVIMPTTLTNGDATTKYNIVVTAEAVQAQGIFSKFDDMKDGISLMNAPQNSSTVEINLVKARFQTAFGY